LSIAHLWQKKRHAAESYLEVCDCLGLPRPSSDAALLLGNKASRHRIRCLLHAQGLASPLVILVPASSWPSKCWPTGHWAATAEWLLEQGYSVALLGSCREEAVGREIAKQISNQRKTAFLFGVLKLGDLPALFESSRLVITGDTGPMHVAAASGAAVLALFGPTDPSLTGPWPAGKAMVLRAPLCDCCKRPRCPKACMRNIRPDRVISAIEAML
jgi:ADP-heptose:LPS heptosyltransferase